MVAGQFGPEAVANPTPGSRGFLKFWWTKGKGRAKWNSWTELYHHLVKYMPPPMAKRVAAQWFHDVKGYWPGDRRNR
jgi:hypothetical protein